ncbi:MAG: PDZ domain-containing protein, partial [Clostridia bacterium]|nr:PDZ domain-containing protein [Clostridia bacterium]
MFKKRVSPFTCIIIALLCCVVTFVAVYARSSVGRDRAVNAVREKTAESEASAAETAKTDEEYYEKLRRMTDFVSQHFLWDVDKEKMWEAIYAAALDSLGDKYTYYMGADEFVSYSSPSGGLVGIGVRYVPDEETGGMFVADVMEKGGAFAAGLKRGDVIIAVGTLRADGENRDELVEAVRGEPGSTVDLAVLRNGKERLFSVTRAPLPGDSAYSI